MRRLRHTIAVLAHYSGADALYRRFTGGGLVILMLHRIRDEDDIHPLSISRASFARIIGWLRKAGALTSLDQGLAAMGQDDRPRVRYSITLDDGYRDNLNLLDPVLGKIPAALYLATDHIDGPPIWIYRLTGAVARRSVDHLDLRVLDLGVHDLSNEAGQARLLAELPARFKQLPHEEFCRQLETVIAALAPTAPLEQEEREMLDWNEVRHLHAHGVAIGAHTCQHVLLSRVDDAHSRAEITHSRDRIRAELGTAPRHFAYPNGGQDDFSERDTEFVRASGFSTAVTTIEGVNRVDTPRHRLLRYNVHESRYLSPGGKLSKALFFSETSGLLSWLRAASKGSY